MSLVIVSNRLPVSIKKVNGELEVYASSGGLATGLSGYTKRAGTKWIGWPGLPSDDLTDDEKIEIARKLKKHRCYPVFLTQKQINEYYNGYSNGVLWPLFHNLPIHAGNTQKNWEAYHHINAIFSHEALRLSEPGSTIWVHDYQLLLVPSMLRAERPLDQIGFFLHIPFPDAETLCSHSHARALVAGVLGADLVGFHTRGYTENFLQSSSQLELGERTDNLIALTNRTVQVTDFPMGIDYAKFARASRQHKVKTEYLKLQARYAGQKVIVTVDRLDPTKGFLERLRAYQQVLSEHDELHGNVVMVMLAVPSRGDIVEYQKLKAKVETLIDDINSTFGTSNWQPVEYMYQTLPFEQLAALYQRADIAFVAPVRDGMNLVAKEYIASQPDQRGVLILSETAGAAEELKEAIQVNPSRPKTLVRGLTRALSLPTKELRERTAHMQKHLETFTVQKWADTFMESLQKPRTLAQIAVPNVTTKTEQEIIANYHQAGRRLLLLDYDGVLHTLVKDPAAAKPSALVLKILERLSNDPANDVVIISGRSKKDLSDWFGHLPIALAAEHGALFRRKGGKNWHKTTNLDMQEWKRKVSDLFDYYTSLTPGSHVEQKEWSVVWHYRAARTYTAQKYLVAVRRLLKPLAKRYGLKIEDGNKVVDVRPIEISKRRAAQEWLIHDHDFMLCLGDDATDEDMFAIMPHHAYSIKVGPGPTVARYRLKNVSEVIRLLGKL